MVSDETFDKILIKDLTVRCIIGVNEPERREKQDVLINITLWADFSEVSKTDDINNTVNYKEVNKHVIELVESSKYFLVETLAENVAKACLQHEKVRKVKVTVEKPGALRYTRSVGVEILRRRD
jgi:D-erythro-7,8-dihydroneopterin triphosphate epimerase